MKAFLILLWLCSICILSTPMAMAGECKAVSVNVGLTTWIWVPAPGECSFQGVDYVFCGYAPVKGTFNGTWWLYSSVEDNFVEVLDPMPGHMGFWAGWLVGSMHTQKGELWTYDTFIFDPVNYYLVAQNSTAVGGTGVFEGATGGFVFLGTDDSGIIRGEICTQ